MKLQKSQPPDSLSSCLYTNPIKSINIFDLSTISIVPQASTSQTKQPTERPALFCGYQCYFWTSQVNPSYPGFLPEGDFKRTISKRQDGVYDGTWVWAHDTASPVPIELVIDEVVRSYNNDPTSTLEQLIEKISRYEHDVEEDYESDTGVIDDEEVFDEQAVEGGMNDGEAIDEEAVEGGMNDEDVIDEEVIDGGMNDEDLIDEESEDEEVVAEECCNGEIVDKEAVEANFVEEDGDEVIDDEDGESNDIVYEDPFPNHHDRHEDLQDDSLSQDEGIPGQEDQQAEDTSDEDLTSSEAEQLNAIATGADEHANTHQADGLIVAPKRKRIEDVEDIDLELQASRLRREYQLRRLDIYHAHNVEVMKLRHEQGRRQGEQ